MALTEEIAIHDQHLTRLTTETSPTLREGFGVGAHTAAELLIIFGANPDRISFGRRLREALRRVSDPGLVRDGPPAGTASIEAATDTPTPPSIEPSSSACGTISRPLITSHAARRTAEPSREIIRCLKRFLAREIYQRVMTDFRARQEIIQAA